MKFQTYKIDYKYSRMGLTQKSQVVKDTIIRNQIF